LFTPSTSLNNNCETIPIVSLERHYKRPFVKKGNPDNLIQIPLKKTLASPSISTLNSGSNTKEINSPQTTLSCLLSNVRSLVPKIDYLESILRLNNISCAFITETWLNKNIDDSAVQVDGYFISQTR
jgi:hypothetical protein